jgi:23S rRNA U2552 (ribose-2'-O)-methylase RlmE/FtsJ
MSFIKYDTSTERVIEPYDKFEEYRSLEKISLSKSKRSRDATDEEIRILKSQLEDVRQSINVNNGAMSMFQQENPDLYTILRYRARPFDSLKSLFLNMAGLKLANIFSLLDIRQVSKVLDIGGGPGGFATYIKSKYPDVEYHGITLPDYPFDSSLNLTSVQTTSVFEENSYSEMDLNADLILSDLANTDAEYQELDLDYITVSNKITFSNLREGGTYICKLFEIHDIDALRLIFNMGRSFANWTLFKPITSPYDNGEIYFIGIGYKGRLYNKNLNIDEVLSLRQDFQTYINVRSDAYLVRMLEKNVPVKYNVNLAKVIWCK